MTAATADRNTPSRDAVDFQFPAAASKKFYVGTIACLDSSGNCTPGATATTLTAAGIVTEYADNSDGGAGDINVKVRRGCFRFANSASTDEIKLSDVGSDCYIVDNQTVAKTDGTTTRSKAGVVRDVDDQGVWVEI